MILCLIENLADMYNIITRNASSTTIHNDIHHFVGIFIIMAIVITGYIQFAGEAEKEENAQRMSQYCLELAKRGISTRACEGLVTASKTPAAPVGPAQ